MYSAESIDKVRSADIVAIVSSFIKLDRHNKSCCPFHGEKTASFSVSVRMQAYKCFGCGVGGDSISFVMLDQNCDFIKAVEIIAELYPLLLENCTDEDDEIDTQAVFESLAGLVGLFIADYREGYGDEKAKDAFQDLVDLALNLYEERITGQPDE